MFKTKARILMLLLCLIMSGTACITAQRLLWSAELVPYFDNREYAYKVVPSCTYFATRLTPTIGVEWNNHAIVAGVSWLQPIDSRFDQACFKPTIYYRYNTSRFAMSMGMFPRTQLIEPLDEYICSDSLKFFSPNIQGALFQYQSVKGYVEALVDWRGIPTETTREAFMVVIQGRYNVTPWLNIGGAGMLNHLARAKNELEGNITNVTDNMMIRPYVGLDFSHSTLLDSLSLRCGYMATFDRIRGVTDWKISHAFVADLVVEWRYLGLRNKLYYGTAAQPFYMKLGNTLYQGDAYYTAPWHNRTELYGYIFRNHFINCMASINVYFTPETVGWQQQLVLRAYINQDYKKQEERKERIRNILN